MDHAVLDLPSTFPFNTLKGWLVGLTWRGFETWGQVRGAAGGGKGPGRLLLWQPANFNSANWTGISAPEAHGTCEPRPLMPVAPAQGRPPGCLLTRLPACPPPLQVSVRNRLMVQMDWLRTKLWGRNITES